MTALPSGLSAAEFWDWYAAVEEWDAAFELDRGQVVERPALCGERHGLVCGGICWRFGDYLFRRLGRGYGLANNTGLVVERDPDTVFCPDFMAYTRRRESPLGNGFATVAPDLVVEVLDPRDSPTAMGKRAARLHAAGVPLVWLVCPDTRRVTASRPGRYPEVRTGGDDLSAPDVLPDFACTVSDLFALPGA